MHLRTATLAVAAALALGLQACASRDGPASLSTDDGTYKERAGNVTESDLFNRLPKVLMRHGYFIERTEPHHKDLEFITQWRYRDPFSDELDRGATGARTRMHLRALWTGRMYSLTIRVENMIANGTGSWIRGESSDEFTEYAKELTGEVRLEIASGIRRH